MTIRVHLGDVFYDKRVKMSFTVVSCCSIDRKSPRRNRLKKDVT